MADWNPKDYKDTGDTVTLGQDLGCDRMALLRKGHVFTLVDKDGKPISKLGMNSFDELWEGPLNRTFGTIG